MSIEREIIKKLFESHRINEDGAEILPQDNETIIRPEVYPISTADRPNISEDLNNGTTLDDFTVSARSVMSSYQNANRWLDTIKESILIDFNLPYFSRIVHDLAHSMPVSFDKFGDILHTINMKVPYPGTEEFLNQINSVEDSIKLVIEILDQIIYNLIMFKGVAETDRVTTPLSILCDPLLTDIQNEYEYYLRVSSQLQYYEGNLALWDKKAYEIYNAKEEGKIE